MCYKKLIPSGILSLVCLLSTTILAEENTSFPFEGFDFSTKKPSREFINDSFDDLFKILSKYSALTDSQKEDSWHKYKGKYVKWQGIVTYKNTDEKNLERIGVEHRVGTNVELIFDDSKKDIVKMITRGDTITYTGKLASLFDRNLLFGLKNTNIEKINDTPIEELKRNLEDKVSLSSQPSSVADKTTKSKDSTVSSEGEFGVSFDDLYDLFASQGNLTYIQKEDLWKNYEGKSIKWRGVITYKGAGMKDWKRVGIKHITGTNVELIFDDDKKDIVNMINIGDTITYTGKLAGLIGRNLLCSIVNVDVKKIGGKTINKAEETTSTELSSDMNIEKTIKEPEIIMSESMAPKVIERDDIKITKTSEGFLEISFDELDEIFGIENRMTESQKDKLWGKYNGKYVRWTGQVVNRGLGKVSGLRMGITHKEGTDIELCFNIEKKVDVLQAKVGDSIVYTGKLVNRRGYILPYLLEDGNIEKVVSAQQTADLTH